MAVPRDPMYTLTIISGEVIEKETDNVRGYVFGDNMPPLSRAWAAFYPAFPNELMGCVLSTSVPTGTIAFIHEISIPIRKDSAYPAISAMVTAAELTEAEVAARVAKDATDLHTHRVIFFVNPFTWTSMYDTIVGSPVANRTVLCQFLIDKVTTKRPTPITLDVSKTEFMPRDMDQCYTILTRYLYMSTERLDGGVGTCEFESIPDLFAPGFIIGLLNLTAEFGREFHQYLGLAVNQQRYNFESFLAVLTETRKIRLYCEDGITPKLPSREIVSCVLLITVCSFFKTMKPNQITKRLETLRAALGFAMVQVTVPDTYSKQCQRFRDTHPDCCRVVLQKIILRLDEFSAVFKPAFENIRGLLDFADMTMFGAIHDWLTVAPKTLAHVNPMVIQEAQVYFANRQAMEATCQAGGYGLAYFKVMNPTSDLTMVSKYPSLTYCARSYKKQTNHTWDLFETRIAEGVDMKALDLAMSQLLSEVGEGRLVGEGEIATLRALGIQTDADGYVRSAALRKQMKEESDRKKQADDQNRLLNLIIGKATPAGEQ